MKKKRKTTKYVCFDKYIPLSDEAMKHFEENTMNKDTHNFELDPHSFRDDGENEIFPAWHGTDLKLDPIATPEQEKAIDDFFRSHPELDNEGPPAPGVFFQGAGIATGFDRNAAWIQTYSGRRFNPTSPNPEAIVIQDIAHALSMQCRFSGHCRKFYSVAQHSVLVSYVCNHEDALWGLMHDATEAYLVDVPRPLKQSGKFQAYIDFETAMQTAVCKRFGLPDREPESVKRADKVLLATEARDLMGPLHPDWIQPVEPLPFKIEAWGPQEAKDNFMKRFFDLLNNTMGYQQYLRSEYPNR